MGASDGKYGDENDVALLKETLFGRSVTQVRMESEHKDQWSGSNAEGELLLDDGTVLALAGNVGGCSCGAGDYALTALNDMPINGITNVEVDVDLSRVEQWGGGPQTYRIFVLAQDTRIRLAEFEGDDGNGYYGTGFWFKVIRSTTA